MRCNVHVECSCNVHVDLMSATSELRAALSQCVIAHLHAQSQQLWQQIETLTIDLDSSSADHSNITRCAELVKAFDANTQQVRHFWLLSTSESLDTTLLNRLLHWHSTQSESGLTPTRLPLILALVDDQGSVSCIESHAGLHSFQSPDKLLKNQSKAQ